MTNGILLLVFLAGSIPLVWQDIRDMAVSQWLLFAVLAVWAAFSMSQTDHWSAVALSSAVLAAGAVYLLLVPEALGEADVVFLAALAWLLPFWSFLLAAGLACVFGAAAFVWLSGGGRKQMIDVPLPFLPCLALGAFAVLGGF